LNIAIQLFLSQLCDRNIAIINNRNNKRAKQITLYKFQLDYKASTTIQASKYGARNK